MKIIEGQYITINEFNIYFSNITTMLLEHFDREEFHDSVVILGSYVKYSVDELRKMHPNKRIIIYQLEQLVGGRTWWNTVTTVKNIRGADEIWEYDALNQKYLEQYHNIKIDKLVYPRYTKALDKSLCTEQEDIDLLFYGFLNERRARILNRLQQNLYGKIKFVFLFGFHNNDLDEYIKRSKVILNIHAFEPYHRQEVVRMFYLINNGKCVLSEKSQLNNLEGMIEESDEYNLVTKLLYLLTDNKYKEFGIQAKEKLIKKSKEI